MRLGNGLLALLGMLGSVLPISAHAQFTDGVVRIGVLTDQSGVLADTSGPGSVWAARKAVEDFGPAAKGLKVEVIAADHQNKADIGAAIARQWYDRDGIDVIVDVPNSSVALAVNSITKNKNKVLLVSGAGTADLTGKACTPNTIHWTYDTWALANAVGKALVTGGKKDWFFLTADYAFGQSLERDTEAVVKDNGGQVLGKARHPLGTSDFASFLLQAQSSKPEVIGLANAGGDTVNSIKQAAEFGLTKQGTTLAALLFTISDVHSVGLSNAQGLVLTEPFYWDLNEQTRKFGRAFAAGMGGRYPTALQAGVYSAIVHYLKAVMAVGGDADGRAIVRKMKEVPTNDPVFGQGSVRADGRKIHPMYLFEAKKPTESQGPWDYYKLRATIPAAEAFRPIELTDCELVKKP